MTSTGRCAVLQRRAHHRRADRRAPGRRRRGSVGAWRPRRSGCGTADGCGRWSSWSSRWTSRCATPACWYDGSRWRATAASRSRPSYAALLDDLAACTDEVADELAAGRLADRGARPPDRCWVGASSTVVAHRRPVRPRWCSRRCARSSPTCSRSPAWTRSRPPTRSRRWRRPQVESSRTTESTTATRSPSVRSATARWRW